VDPTRAQALEQAQLLHRHIIGDMSLRAGEDANVTYRRLEHAVLDTAETFLAWLRGPVRLKATFGLVVDQATHQPTGTILEGPTMQLHDNEQVDVTYAAADAKGFETFDALTFDVSDPAAVSVVGADDGDSHTVTYVAGNPANGVTVVVSDPTALDPVTGLALARTEVFDVLPAGAVAISAVFGAPVLQP
jgi:hypothetical protein